MSALIPTVQACTEAGVTPYLAISREKHHSWLAATLRKPDVQPGEDASPVEQMVYRLQTAEGRKLYAKRKKTAEPVFAIVKSAIGFQSFLLRGLEKVRGEWKLVCMAYNHKHVHALVAACPTSRAAA